MWIKRNFWNLLSAVLGFAGLVGGYYFYLSSLKVRGLAIQETSAHSRIVNSELAGGALRLVKKDGSEIKQDVYVVTLAIWNSGNDSLKADSILKDITISLSTESELLEASLLKVSRPDIVDFSIEAGKSDFKVKWKILEPSDGASIQIVYLANAAAQLGIDGIVEGLDGFNDVTADPLAGFRTVIKFGLLFLVVFAFVAVGFAACIWYSKIMAPRPRLKAYVSIGFSLFCALIGFAGAAFSIAKLIDSYKQLRKQEAISVPASIRLLK